MEHDLLEFVEENRKGFVKLEAQILRRIVRHTVNLDITFKDQNRNVWVNCLVCNDRPLYEFLVEEEFVHLYMCHKCKTKFIDKRKKYANK